MNAIGNDGETGTGAATARQTGTDGDGDGDGALTDAGVGPITVARAASLKRPRTRELLAGALLAAFLSACVAGVMLQIWNQPLHVPFQYSQSAHADEQDAMLEAMVDAQVIRTGWFFHEPRLNAPDQQDWIEWPMGGDTLAYVIKKGIATTTDDPYVVMNVFWLLTFPMVGAAAYPAARLLGCRRGSALAGSVLFAMAPYHLRNGVGHENLAFFVAIPFAVLLLVRLLGPAPPIIAARDADGARHAAAPARARVWRVLWPVLVAVMIAIDNYYYLAFFLVLGVLCAATAAVVRRDWRPVASMGILGGVMVATSALASLPTILWTRSAGPNPMVPLQRVMGASDAFPLRPIELFTPVAGHRLGVFDALSTALSPHLTAEWTTANLGLFASIGVVVALVSVAQRCLNRRPPGRSVDTRLGIVVVWVLVLSVAGGGDRVLELTGLGAIRAWVRIAIFVAFAGVVASCRLLDRLGAALGRTRPTFARVAWPAVLVLVVLLGVLDQVVPRAIPDARANEAAYDADAAFVGAIADRLPDGAMVFQLPTVKFPESGVVKYASDYDQLKQGYLLNSTLRWSAGGVQGRSADWQPVATDQKMPIVVRALAATGFSAITVDRRAYEDLGKAVVDDLTAILGPPFATSQDRLLAWDLRPYASRLATTTSESDRALWRDQALEAPRLYLTSDSLVLRSRNGEGHMCREALLTVVVPDGHRWSGTLTISFPRVAQYDQRGPTIVTTPTETKVLAPDVKSVSLPMQISGSTPISITTPQLQPCEDPDSMRVPLSTSWVYD